MSRRNPSSTDDIIDSRDVIERRDELQNTLDDLKYEVEEAETALKEAKEAYDKATVDERMDGELGDEVVRCETALTEAKLNLIQWTGGVHDGKEYDSDCDADELKILVALCVDGDNASSDWTHGVPMINEGYFQKYAEELADDIGAVKGEGWPNHHIDWRAAAAELQQDYTVIEFDNVTFYVR